MVLVQVRLARAARALGFVVAVGLAMPALAQDFVNFESGQVRPLLLSPDGSRLYAVNTPDNQLEIFTVAGGTLTHAGSVPVGLEPVAVAARNDGEVWVVNHLSDSISVVDVAADPPRVVRTLLTCDEPRDIVFAGPGNGRAFVSAARRGQNCTVSANLTTAGTGRALVQVYDAAALGTSVTGTVLTTVVLFGDTPRALARSADGNTVYAAVFHSGNQTTVLNDAWVCDGGDDAPPCVIAGGRTAPGGLPWPNENFEAIVGPEVGLIVRRDPGSGQWRDTLDRDWSDVVRFELPDFDVFSIDAAAPLPVQTASVAGVGTVLFNMAVNPANGKVYVSNTEARNEVRFEGPGLFAGTAGATVQGHLHEARITVLDGGAPLPRHLNKHIDYSERPAPPGIKDHSLATPVDMAVSADGGTVYVAAFGSAKVGVFDAAELESDTLVPNSGAHIEVSGGGPSGLALDEVNDRLYVYTRFDNAISVIDLTTANEIAHLPVHSPESTTILAGRPLLYDAHFTSSNGEASCSSCHVFGDFDSLAWDLGNPDDTVLNNPLPLRIPSVPPISVEDFHPLKGPMTTQSLRGMADHGSMHWRGDRTGGNDVDSDAFDEVRAFTKFNPAFPGLLGRDDELSAADMQAFTDFILTVTYPPNPVRALDNSLTVAQQAGRDLYFGRVTDTLFNCNGCHTLDPGAGFFGSDGFGTFEGETQLFKVPHLRNAYQKVGMFGRPQDAGRGPQVRGVGYLHDGSIDTIRRFLAAGVFTVNAQERRDLEDFVFAFDSNLAPIVGQQATLTSTSAVDVGARIDLLIARAAAGECDLVVKGTLAGEARGALRLPDGSFALDRVSEAPLADAALRAAAATPGQELTYTCVPPGSGERIGLDRDRDGFRDRDEIDRGADPADAADFPGANAVPVRASLFDLRDDATAPIDPERSKLTFKSKKYQGSPSGVVAPAWDSADDPTIGGATLTLHRGDASVVTVLALPAAGWQRSGTPAKPVYKYRDRDRVSGPVTTVTLRADKLIIKGKGAGLYQLDGAPQGSMVLRLEVGADVEFCAVAAPAVPATSFDTTERFSAEKHTAAPPTCPTPPL